MPPPIRYDLAPGLPDLRAFPRRRWADAVRAVAGSAVHYDLGLPDPAGHAVLRTTVAQYLRRSRGADTHAASVSVCAGITDGLVRTCRALRAEGIADLAVEIRAGGGCGTPRRAPACAYTRCPAHL